MNRENKFTNREFLMMFGGKPKKLSTKLYKEFSHKMEQFRETASKDI